MSSTIYKIIIIRNKHSGAILYCRSIFILYVLLRRIPIFVNRLGVNPERGEDNAVFLQLTPMVESHQRIVQQQQVVYFLNKKEGKGTDQWKNCIVC